MRTTQENHARDSQIIWATSMLMKDFGEILHYISGLVTSLRCWWLIFYIVSHGQNYLAIKLSRLLSHQHHCRLQSIPISLHWKQKKIFHSNDVSERGCRWHTWPNLSLSSQARHQHISRSTCSAHSLFQYSIKSCSMTTLNLITGF